MKILALDSSATVASVALTEDGKLLSEYTLNNKNTHSETLLPMIESILGYFSLTPADIDLFAASAGPGSFTGVRIGAATLKGLAFASGKPCVEISTLEALAYNALGIEGLICPVMNARRSQVYTALFRSDGERLTRLMPDSALSVSDLYEQLLAMGEKVCFVGDGYEVALPVCESIAKPTPERMRHQSAFSVAAVALGLYGDGKRGSDADFKVNYLRPSQAERELMNKNKDKEDKI